MLNLPQFNKAKMSRNTTLIAPRTNIAAATPNGYLFPQEQHAQAMQTLSESARVTNPGHLRDLKSKLHINTSSEEEAEMVDEAGMAKLSSRP